ncbi:MAG: hypothetical protein ACR2JB_17255 [Bryobacteraceae bacterium]
MRFTWFTLPIFLAAGVACAHGSSLSTELASISSRSNIEAIVDPYIARAATTLLLAAEVSSLCKTSVLNALRSMWGQ